jgi:gluconolactonase
MKLSNYALSYASAIKQGQMTLFDFLAICRELGLEGASLSLGELSDTKVETLAKVRRAYLDHGLSVSIVAVTTNFGHSDRARHEAQLKEARTAIDVAAFLGAPLIRIFAGSAANAQDQPRAWAQAVAAVRQLCDEGERVGVPLGLQNHNHGALCGTGDDVKRFIQEVNHPNLTYVLDCGQFVGSGGASGKATRGEQVSATAHYESIRQTAALARYVRVKFYNPRPDGSDPIVDYARVFEILRSAHYPGFLDIVYEPHVAGGESIRTAIPKIVGFLRRLMASGAQAAAPTGADRYAGLSNADYLDDNQLRRETEVAFLEGPTVHRSGMVYFTNMRAQQILTWDPAAKRVGVFRSNSQDANGLIFDTQGRLIACEGVGRVTRTDLETGRITVLADKYEGKPFGSPNDVDLDSQGRIYFTSRRAEGTDPEKTEVINGVYRIDPDGKITRILESPAIDMPNGIAIAPGDRTLYLIDADGRADHARRIRAYDLKPDGSVANERTLYDFYPGRSGDGMSSDAEGNLYVMAGLHRRRGNSETLDTKPGLHVISPQGKLLAFLETPEDTVTNCAFGGPDRRTLYITCGKLLLSVRTKIPGKPV